MASKLGMWNTHVADSSNRSSQRGSGRWQWHGAGADSRQNEPWTGHEQDMGMERRVVEDQYSKVELPNRFWNQLRFGGAARVAGAGERGVPSCSMEAFAETQS